MIDNATEEGNTENEENLRQNIAKNPKKWVLRQITSEAENLLKTVRNQSMMNYSQIY